MNEEDRGWHRFYYLRAYRRSTEIIPDFTSTVYTYWGLDGERAPQGTTEIIIHPSVTTVPSSNMLSIVVNPWCGLQYLTLSHGLKGLLSGVVCP